MTHESKEFVQQLISLRRQVQDSLAQSSQPTTRRLARKLQRIESALDRIDTGMYGRCQFCDKRIGKNRLKQLPYAELCLACQHKRES